jgi:4-aminobutyrate aminotransferase/(S)-3-amino-2-methylpropionate transaminase
MQAIELVMPGTRDTTKEPNSAATSAIATWAWKHGIILLTAGTYGNVIRFLPSLAISDALLADALAVLDEGISTL